MSQGPLQFRAVLTVDATDPERGSVLKTVRRGATKWLHETRGYGLDALSFSGLRQLSSEAALDVTTAYDPGGDEAGLRVQLVEDQEQMQWVTTVTALAPGEDHSALVCLELECHTAGSPPLTGPPRLIRELLGQLPAGDGWSPRLDGGFEHVAPLTVQPIEVTAGGIDGLLHVLTHQDRIKPAVVTARPSIANSTWSYRLQKIWDRTAGFSSHYLLTDAAAVSALREEIGDHHWVPPGAVRTFLPEVDPAWPADGFRHRFLTFQRMADRNDHAWRWISAAIHEHSNTSPLPARLASTVMLATVAAPTAWPEPPAPAPEPVPDLGGLEAEATRLRRAVTQLTNRASDLEQAAETRRALHTGDVLRLQNRLNDANAQLHAAKDEHDSDIAEYVETLDDLTRANAEIDRLRLLLSRQGAGQEAYAGLDEDGPGAPRTFEEVLARLEELPCLHFTGRREKTLELDDTDARKVPVWAGKVWLALRALSSYGTISTTAGFNGDFREFCRRQPEGAVVYPANKIAMAESDGATNQWASERTLPVPSAVDPSGLLLMEPHIKIDSKGKISPRIYFHDDTAGVTASVLVGLIGRHPTNSMS